MPNPILINMRLQMKRDALKNLTERSLDLEKQRDEVLAAAEGAEDETDLDSIQAKSDEIDKKIADLQAQKKKLEEEAEKLEGDLEEANKTPQTEPAKGEDRSKKVEITRDMKSDEQMRSLLEFVKSNGQKREGLVTTDLGALIPKDVVYVPEEAVDTKYDLTKVIRTQGVTKSAGTYPVLQSTDEMLHTVGELEANPELAKPSTTDVEWKVETYRGQITYSNESLQDVVDFKNVIGEQVSQIIVNTKNNAVATVLKTATAKAVTSLDELKTLVNTGFDPAYTLGLVVTQSAYDWLDQLKDGNGRYLMQDNVTAPTGKGVLGLPITVVKDTAFGKQGDKLAFVGDGARFARLFDRIGVSVDFAIDARYGRALMAAVRFDVEVTDPAAGAFVTFGDPAPKA